MASQSREDFALSYQNLPEFDPEKHLVFGTKAEAMSAEAQITADMGFSGAITQRWDIPVQVADGRWVIAKPEK